MSGRSIPATETPRLVDDLDSLLRVLGHRERFEARQTILSERTPGCALYLVEAGCVQRVDDRQPPVSINVGEMFGERALLGQNSGDARFIAESGAVVRVIGRQEILRAFSDDLIGLHSLLTRLQQIRDARFAREAAVTPKAFVATLAREALSHRALSHPYLKCLGDGRLPDLRWALRDFATHYQGYSRFFPNFLTTVISRLEDPEQRAALMANFVEESGVYDAEDLAALARHGVQREWIEGIPHPFLFARFAEAVDAPTGTQHEADQVVCWREVFLGILGSGSPAEAIGALGLGTENVVSHMYRPFVAAIDRLRLAPEATVFFPLHTLIDDEHQLVLQDIATSFADTPAGKTALRHGMIKALNGRSAFWDWLLERAMNPSRAEAVL